MRYPAVIVPGYYGSKLSDADNDLVWIDGLAVLNPHATMETLTLAPQTWNRLHPSGILDEIGLLPFISPDIYKRLVRFLTNNLNYEDRLVKPFWYDWRKSLKEAARLLDRQIRRWLTETQAERVDLITHSFGGLVARAYLAAMPNPPVRHLITIGTPHRGMLKTMQALTHGVNLAFFTRAMTRPTARTFPSAYELLPQAPSDKLFQWNGGDASPFTETGWCDPSLLPALADAAGTIAALSTQVPVELTCVYGTRLETLTLAQGTPGNVAYEKTDAGDGTVPMCSGRGDGLTSTTAAHRYPIPYGNHMLLFDDPAVEDLLTELLLRDRAPQVQFIARFAQEKFYRARSKNQLIVSFTDDHGAPISNATVTLHETAPRKRTTVLHPSADGDFLARVTMPGPGSAFRCTITAASPVVDRTYSRTVLLAASS